MKPIWHDYQPLITINLVPRPLASPRLASPRLASPALPFPNAQINAQNQCPTTMPNHHAQTQCPITMPKRNAQTPRPINAQTQCPNTTPNHHAKHGKTTGESMTMQWQGNGGLQCGRAMGDYNVGETMG